MPAIKAPSGIEWNYDLDGEGEPILFIHGWGVDKRIWRQQSKYFSQQYKILTVDLPGHGQSSWRKVAMGVMAEDLKAILERIPIDCVSIIGSSIGGMLALKLYEIYPEVVKRLVFIGSMPKFAKSEDYPYGLDVGQIRKLGGQLKTNYPAMVNIFFRSLFTIEERGSRRFKWLMKFRQTNQVPMKEALIEYLDILEAEDLRNVLKNVQAPMQFINGTHDEICRRDTMDYLQSVLPSARFDFFKRCGHFPFLSKPHEFNAVLEDFLKS